MQRRERHVAELSIEWVVRGEVRGMSIFEEGSLMGKK